MNGSLIPNLTPTQDVGMHLKCFSHSGESIENKN